MKYVAFLRGINVGGKSMIKMSELQAALSDCGLQNVRTYILSGNVLFESDQHDRSALTLVVQGCIKKTFKLEVGVVVFSGPDWQTIIQNAPDWWGTDTDWKHNILILLEPYPTDDIQALLDSLKPDIESCVTGNGVLYQSCAWAGVSRAATGSKLASRPIYKKMTVRNYNTATKLATLLAG